ncbi:MAG TPA: hypothetical protein VGG38_12245 [Acidimicrobiales bacterium]|jgi:hypothetical protein
MTKEEHHRRAEEYIDRIIAINKKYGMGGETPDDVYKEAVKRAASAFRGLVPTS